jgi:general stress protein YciG
MSEAMMKDEQMDDLKESTELSTSAEQPSTSTEKPKRPRGFAAMDPKLVSELATRGGKAAHRAGTAHEFTSEEARIAGRKGALVTHAKRRAKLMAAEGGSVQ